MPLETSDNNQLSDVRQTIQELKEMIIVQGKQLVDLQKRIASLEGDKENQEWEDASQPMFFLRSNKPPLQRKQEQEIITGERAEGIARQHNDSPAVGFEEKVAVSWFARIGIVALVLGVSFFLKYAFDNDWIGPAGRVAMGIAAGIILLIIGERIIRKYFVYAQIITGGGLVLFYLSIFAAFQYYHLIDQVLAFSSMILVTGAGIILSLRYKALPLIIAAIIGGFMTPILISTGENNFFTLFSYVLLLDFAILIVSYFEKWRELNFIGFLGTVFMLMGWAGTYYTDDQMYNVMFFLTIFFLIYSVSSLIYNLANKELSSGTEQILTVLTGLSYFIASYSLLNDDYHAIMGFFALGLGIYYLLWAYAVRLLTPGDKPLSEFLAFFTVGFITLAFPLQFEGNVITICWAVEALVLFFLALRTGQRPIQIFSYCVSCLALARLMFIDSLTDLHNPMIIVNSRFLTFSLVIILTYFVALLHFNYKKAVNDIMKPILSLTISACIVIANLLTIFIISQEIVVYYDNQKNQLQSQRYGNSYDRYNYGYQARGAANTNKYRQSYDQIRNRSSIALSLFWLGYSVILLVIGFLGRFKVLRVGGILLLILSILKLFFFDLWSLGQLYRIVSSICLGIVLMVISFTYQKYKDFIKENLM